MHRHAGTTVLQPEQQPEQGQPSFSRPQPRTFRASDEDRRRAAEQLQAHYVAGRLDSAELETRVERAFNAVTLADLDALFVDLPPLPADQAQPDRPADEADYQGHRSDVGGKPFSAHAMSYLLVMVMLVAIWALTTPGGYFWPIWPMLGWGIGLASHWMAARSRGTPPHGSRWHC